MQHLDSQCLVADVTLKRHGQRIAPSRPFRRVSNISQSHSGLDKVQGMSDC